MSFGSRLRELRRGADLTQADLANGVGCSANMLRKLESDERRPSRALAERIAQVLGLTAANQADFLRQARATPAVRHSALPAALTRFVDREEALTELRALLARPDVRQVTLVGPPGVGKTRLALELAGAIESEFDHGVTFVPLASVREAALVAETLAAALGVRPTAGSTPEVELRNHVRQRHACLVVDNFEQVMDARGVLAGLLPVAPRLKLLVTSREALSIYGEHVYLVQPLGLARPSEKRPSPAEVLFLDRARATRPSFAESPDSARIVAHICARLEGLPLALELAAARTRIDSPVELLRRLEQRLDALSSGPSDLTPRQRSLRGALDWSYELLEPNQQRLFTSLAVFVGGCTRDAIAAVCGADHLEALVDKSLVVLTHDDGRARFDMLDTVRDYAHEHLAHDQREVLGLRHARYFATSPKRRKTGSRARTRSAGSQISTASTPTLAPRSIRRWAHMIRSWPGECAPRCGRSGGRARTSTWRTGGLPRHWSSVPRCRRRCAPRC